MDLLIDDGEKVIPTEVKAAENFRVKVWRCTEKNMIRLFASERLWQITETKITDLCIFLFTVITNWIWRDIKNFWKFPKWQGGKIWLPQEVASTDFVHPVGVQIGLVVKCSHSLFYFQNRCTQKKYKIQILE